MGTLRNKRKLAAVSRETPESTRSGRTQNILDLELTQDYISQVSEEIEGRVTKKLSKEFSRTESRILGALSRLDEFLLNPQVRTCSVAVPGTSRSSNLENQGTNEDRPSDDPGPEVEFSSPPLGQKQILTTINDFLNSAGFAVVLRQRPPFCTFDPIFFRPLIPNKKLRFCSMVLQKKHEQIIYWGCLQCSFLMSVELFTHVLSRNEREL